MAKKQVLQITRANFADIVLESPQPVLVDFHADWCQPCRMLAPVVDDLAQAFEGRVLVGKVNVDEHPELARTYAISSIPSLFLFRDGEVIDRIVGLASREDLARALESAAA